LSELITVDSFPSARFTDVVVPSASVTASCEAVVTVSEGAAAVV